mgnify:CR=1 FL=1
MRWVASMVAEVHRVLMRGGVFIYPLDSDNRSAGGKLRLFYEANPMSFLIEQAGGKAIAGPGQRVLDIEPATLHERCPLFVGSPNMVDKLAQLIAESE